MPDYINLPTASVKNQGWPWVQSTNNSSLFLEEGDVWPKISIVTPNYNYGQYLEETIRSVLLQGYPNLEYIIMDGGSTDNSVEIIKKYEPWITYWESEKDRGQTHAINKGFKKATGDIVAWINSDDVYVPEAFHVVAQHHLENPGQIILGDVEDFYDDESQPPNRKRLHHVMPSSMLKPLDGSWFWHQPGTFVPMKIQNKIGKLDENLHYAFDKDWIFRLVEIAPVHYLNTVVARFRIHSEAKTSSGMDTWIKEIYQVNQRYISLADPGSAHHLLALYHLRLAGLYLCEHTEYEPFFDRRCAAMEMLRAPSIIFSTDGLRLLRRLILPRALWRTG